ncbi:GntR family transcriptional regulator [Aestuariibius insulae]|uniref:GntR family transcriptional regulator n=1 Tax=Aestuariibius insulae TaxID=2058287 RepID=UPI00345F096E
MSQSLPLYLQISERLTREIAAGRLPDGTRLPPERDMAVKEGTAVGTLRKALAELEERGLLERRQGSGNYVRARRVKSIYGFLRLERPDGGGLPTAETLSLDRESQAFKAAHRIRRLRRLDGAPVALEEIHLDARWARDLAEPLPEALYRHYAEAFDLDIGRIEDRVGISDVPDWAPPFFSMAAGEVSGYVARRAWSATDGLAEISETWFDPARARYIARDSQGI